MQGSRSDLLLFLVMAVCCAAPIFLAAGGLGLLVGLMSGYGGFILIGVALVSVGYWLWRKKKQKGCCSR